MEGRKEGRETGRVCVSAPLPREAGLCGRHQVGYRSSLADEVESSAHTHTYWAPSVCWGPCPFLSPSSPGPSGCGVQRAPTTLPPPPLPGSRRLREDAGTASSQQLWGPLRAGERPGSGRGGSCAQKERLGLNVGAQVGEERQSQGPQVEDTTARSVPPSVVRLCDVREPDWAQISAQSLKENTSGAAQLRRSRTRCLRGASTLSPG